MNSAIIVAAGRGMRMNTSMSKQYLQIGGRAILYWTVRVFLDHPNIDEIIVIIKREDEMLYKTCVGQYIDKEKKVKVVYGGDRRMDSVLCGLNALGEEAKHVLIHDGVRPFVRASEIDAVLKALEEYPGCICGTYVKDTMKIVDEHGLVTHTPPRNKVFAAQTPQGFHVEELRRAYHLLEERKDTEAIEVTDDALVMERSGATIKTVVGSYENIKITTQEDMELAENIFEKRRLKEKL